jgi:hypothetical protein
MSVTESLVTDSLMRSNYHNYHFIAVSQDSYKTLTQAFHQGKNLVFITEVLKAQSNEKTVVIKIMSHKCIKYLRKLKINVAKDVVPFSLVKSSDVLEEQI